MVKFLKTGEPVKYDNFGKDFSFGNEVYRIVDVEKEGYMVGNKTTKPFFAYDYQLQRIEIVCKECGAEKKVATGLCMGCGKFPTNPKI